MVEYGSFARLGVLRIWLQFNKTRREKVLVTNESHRD
jgi:hypothetical protein